MKTAFIPVPGRALLLPISGPEGKTCLATFVSFFPLAGFFTIVRNSQLFR